MSVFYENFERHSGGQGLKAHATHYCPGCTHGVIHRMVHTESKFKNDEFKQVRGRKIEVHPEQLVQEFTLNLQTFINICRARGITPVLLTMPSRLKDDPDPLIRRLMQRTSIAATRPPVTFGSNRCPTTQRKVSVNR